MKGTGLPEGDGALKRRIIRAYRDPIIMAYCTIRFVIMNMHILEEIGSQLPDRGSILDVGCGFGLFSLYYAAQKRGRHITSLDIDAKRIRKAQHAAENLNLGAQIDFMHKGAEDLRGIEGRFSAAYMLDLMHHLPPALVPLVLGGLHALLDKGGRLVVKDVATTPFWKKWFTWLADMAMSPRTPPHYMSVEACRALLEQVGFEIEAVHSIADVLPYPHVIYVCRKA